MNRERTKDLIVFRYFPLRNSTHLLDQHAAAGRHYYGGHAFGIMYLASSLQAETHNTGFQIFLTKKINEFWRTRWKSAVITPLFLDLTLTVLNHHAYSAHSI